MVKVVVVGGGWSGCGAAIAAAKAGAQVTLLERTDMLLGTGLVGKVATKLTDDKDSNKAISAGDTVTATLTVTADTGDQLSAKAPALAGWTVASESASQWVYTMNITVAA